MRSFRATTTKHLPTPSCRNHQADNVRGSWEELEKFPGAKRSAGLGSTGVLRNLQARGWDLTVNREFRRLRSCRGLGNHSPSL
jgi:hypothetical protein